MGSRMPTKGLKTKNELKKGHKRNYQTNKNYSFQFLVQCKLFAGESIAGILFAVNCSYINWSQA